jgi:hypothetical protein
MGQFSGPRSTSSNKLVARGATTIEEDEEEEPIGSGRKAKKESLAELFSSEPASPDPAMMGRRGSAPIKRTAPAVILATPPPPAPVAESNPAPPPPPRNDDDFDVAERRAARLKPKSEARELADFFNSTPPPPSTISRDDEPPPTAKSSKGFRGLLSKVTGKKNKDSEDRQSVIIGTPPSGLPPSGSTSRLNSYTMDEGMPARRQKSMQSLASGAPTTYKVSEDAPAVPSKGMLRKKSDARDTAGIAAAVLGGVGGSEAVNSRDGTGTSPLADPSTLPAITSSVGTGTSSRSTGPVVPTRVTSFERKDGKVLEDEYIRPQEEQIETPIRSVDSESKGIDTTPKPNTSTDGRLPAPLVLFEPIRPSPPERSATAMTTSDAHSFRTANEGPSTSTLGQESTVEGAVGTTPLAHPPSTSTNTADPEPSIPLADLAPLRQLLQHATTADECRLLISAILTQWRVPSSSSSSEYTPSSPEARVTAWLLAGRDGPPGDTPSSSTFSTTKYEEEDLVVTPTAIDNARLPNVSMSEMDDDRGNEEEELISEITDDESEASLSRDDLGEGLPPSFAKSGLRSAPIRYGFPHDREGQGQGLEGEI